MVLLIFYCSVFSLTNQLIITFSEMSIKNGLKVETMSYVLKMWGMKFGTWWNQQTLLELHLPIF